MSSDAAELARRLARDAEAVCRHYLSNGRHQGRYWLVGDVANTKGRSLYVRLRGPVSGKGAAGKWTDATTGQHGYLIDLIGLSCRFDRLHDVLDEARRFLDLPQPEPLREPPAPTGSPKAARRLLAISQPLSGTIAETYLRRRGITVLHGHGALRFHPRCYYRPHADAPTQTWPALVAAVIETMLSLRNVLPTMPMAAALSANHLAAILFPATLRRLYVARDRDPAGDTAMATLTERARAAGIQALSLSPTLGDFNEDLRRSGGDDLRAALQAQLAPADVARFMAPTVEAGKCG